MACRYYYCVLIKKQMPIPIPALVNINQLNYKDNLVKVPFLYLQYLDEIIS